MSCRIRKGSLPVLEALRFEADDMADLRSRDIFDEVYRKHFKNIFLCAYSVLSDVEDSKDVTQEAFENFYRKNQKFPTIADAKYHLLRNVRNLSLNLLKHKKVEKKKMPLLAEGSCQLVSGDCADQLSFSDVMGIVDDALSGKEELKEIFCMKVFWGLAYQEIAVIRGIPLSSAKSKLYRARILVREKIEEKAGQ